MNQADLTVAFWSKTFTMKKLLNRSLFLVLFSLFSAENFSQEMTDTSMIKMSVEDSIKMLVNRSKVQKTCAIILTGVCFTTTVIALYQIARIDEYMFTDHGPNISTGLTVTMISSAVGATAFILASSHSRKKAEKLQRRQQDDYSSPKTRQGQTVLIGRSPFQQSSSRLLQKTSFGISSDKLNMGYISKPAKINSLVLSISLGK